MNRTDQLESLVEALTNLVDVLSFDASCQWHRHFDYCLSQAIMLKSDGFDQASLNMLSGSVRSAYGGMGSFNDYVPFVFKDDGSHQIIQGMDNFDLFAGQAYDLALNLMVIGER